MLSENQGDKLYKQTNEKLHSIICRISEMLPVEEVEQLNRFVFVGEPTVAIEGICGALGNLKAVIDRDLYERLCELGRDLDADMSFLDGAWSLNECRTGCTHILSLPIIWADQASSLLHVIQDDHGNTQTVPSSKVVQGD
jgi:hypothetical protein